MARKPIKTSIIKQLFAVSGNKCAFPNCNQSLVDDKESVGLGVICHIHAVSPDGPRYDPSLSDDEINGFDNLMILCPSHHTIIDRNYEKYDAPTLKKIKFDHESQFTGKTIGIDPSSNIFLSSLELEAPISSVQARLPSKKYYPEISNYIQRYVEPVSSASYTYGLESSKLFDIINEHNRITILGVAGSGKSIELANLAHQYSSFETDLYPVMIRLNLLTDQSSIDELLSLEYPQINDIPEDRLLIILDAIDEVPSRFLDKGFTNVQFLSKKRPNSKIIVSCRNNFYSTETNNLPARLEDFKTYRIRHLGHESIIQYIKTTLPKIDASSLVNDLRIKKYYDLLSSPFYLVKLTKYFEENEEIPASRKVVFDYLINQRIENDIYKFKNSGLNISDYKYKIEKQIEVLAVTAEALGRNYLEENEVQRIIETSDFIKIIKRTFLFNKSEISSIWEFEHNNFQEFLAGRYLSNQPLSKIKEFVSYKPDYTKIKPSWLNTLSFTISNLDDNTKLDELVNWIQLTDPDVLIRFEKDKLDIQTREHIFRKIYESFSDKGIQIRSEKFEIEDLALFVSDSDEILNYLLEKIKDTGNNIIDLQAVQVLHVFQNVSSKNSLISNILLEKIQDDKLSEDVKYISLIGLASLDLCSKKLTQSIMQTIDLTKSQYLRAGFYKYLSSCNDITPYLDILLEGIYRLAPIRVSHGQSSQTKEPKFLDEDFHLKLLLKKVDSLQGIETILNWAIQVDNYSKMESVFFEVLEETINSASQVCKDENHPIIDKIVELLVNFCSQHETRLNGAFKNFFLRTNSQLSTFKKLYLSSIESEQNKKHSLYIAMGHTCNKEAIDFLILEIKKGQLVEPETWKIRNFLSFHAYSDCSEYYQGELIKIDKKKYAQKQPDHRSSLEQRLKRDEELLLNKDEYVAEVNSLLESITNEAEISYDQLWEWKKINFIEETLTNHVVVDLLRSLTKDRSRVSIEEIQSYILDEKKWKWYVISNLIAIDSNNKDYQFSDHAIDYISDWVLNNVSNCDFSTAIRTNSNGSYSYRRLELYIAYFILRFDLKISDFEYLSLLEVDCHLLPTKNSQDSQLNSEESSSVINFLTLKLGKKAVGNQVIQNLSNRQLPQIVRESHFKYCRDNKVTEASSFVLLEINQFKQSEARDHELERYISLFLELEGNENDLIELLPHFTPSTHVYVCEELANRNNHDVLNIITSTLKDKPSDEDIFLRYILAFSSLKPNQGFEYLKNWITRNHRFPDRSQITLQVDETQLNNLFAVYEDSIANKYGDDFWTGREDYLAKIIELGSLSARSYKEVHDKFKSWIGKYDNLKFLHYRIQQLEQQYYQHKSESLTLDAAIEMITSNPIEIQQGSIKVRIQLFWDKHKFIIEIIVAIISIIGFFSLF